MTERPQRIFTPFTHTPVLGSTRPPLLALFGAIRPCSALFGLKTVISALLVRGLV